MDQFVRTLMAAAPLTPDEELSLARRARAGDRAARGALITSGLRSVALRARMMGLRGEELRDGVQSGAVGLIRAVDRFDPEQGVRLSTYAWRWIGAEMSPRHRREVAWSEVETVWAPTPDDDLGLLDGLSDVETQVLNMRFGLAFEGATPLSRDAVAERLGLTISQVRTVEGKAMRQVRRGLAKVADRAPHQ